MKIIVKDNRERVKKENSIIDILKWGVIHGAPKELFIAKR